MEVDYKPITLPSKCLVYKDVDPTKIQIRTLRGKDEKLIAEVNYDNYERQLLTILRNVIQGIDPAKLTLGDRLYILVWEAINSYGKDFDVEHNCTECFERVTSTVDLSTLEVVELPDDFKEPYPIKLSTGDVVNLRLFRVEDEIKIAEYEKNDKASWLYRFAVPIVSEKGIWDRVSFLENLPVKDMAAIRAFHNKFQHGPKMEATYTCRKCGGTGVVPVPFRTEMLFPYGNALRRYIADGV